MRIGTTPTHTFVIPFQTDMIRECQIIYQQNEVEVLSKYKRDCALEGDTISVTLTQEETFKFDSTRNVNVQVRVVTHEGDAFASDPICIRCDKCLANEVL